MRVNTGGVDDFTHSHFKGTIMEYIKGLTKGILSSSEVDVLIQIYDRVTNQPWFASNAYSREGFAMRLVCLFRYGIVNPAHLERIAIVWSLKDFDNNMRTARGAKQKALY